VNKDQLEDGFMDPKISRRTFLEVAAVGAAGVAALGAAGCAMQQTRSGPWAPVDAAARPKVRIAKVYAGRARPGWPMAAVDVEAERKRVEAQLARVMPTMPDIEFIDVGLVTSDQQIAEVKEKCRSADGILVMQLTMGVGALLNALLELDVPVVLFAEPYCGHDWHTVASLQREGKRIDCWASSRFEDVAAAVRPIRAIRRLKDAKVLHLSQGDANAEYVKLVKDKFGTEIKSLHLADLEAAYKAVSRAAAQAEADDWVRGAEKIVEPTPLDILKAARMALALKAIVDAERADIITINCLGMGLIDRDMGYPCLGFVRLNNMGLGGVCEADLKSTMTQLIFTHLVGRTGFVTDPCFDYSNNTIIHAHCVGATQMEGPDGPTSPYIIRSHLEDNRGAVLQVKMRTGVPVTMARLIGGDVMLFSTGQAVDSPLVERACRTKVTVRVEHPERFMENWSCGLHRVIFYGDHTRDVERFCRFMKIRFVREGEADLRDVPGLEWVPRIHA
jgi:L-fucose isomerase-like protein